MFNSFVLTWERNFEVTFRIFSVLVFQISVLESSFRYLSVLKLAMMKNVKIVKFRPLNQSFTNISFFTTKILHRFVSFCISLIFTYCLFVEKKLVTIEHEKLSNLIKLIKTF